MLILAIKGILIGFLLTFFSITMITYITVTALNKGRQSCYFSISGYLSGQILMAVIAILFHTMLLNATQMLSLYQAWTWLAFIVLSYLSYRLYTMDTSVIQAANISTADKYKYGQFLSNIKLILNGFLITLVVPQRVLLYLAVFTYLHIGSSALASIESLILICHIVIGSAIWWLFYIRNIGHLQQTKALKLHNINKVAACALGALALYGLIRNYLINV